MKAIKEAKEAMEAMEAEAKAKEGNSLVRTVTLPKDVRRPSMYLNRVQPFPSPALEHVKDEGDKNGEMRARLGLQDDGVVGEVRAQPVDGPRLP